MNILQDPRIVNFVIMGLYTANIIRWAIEGKPVDVIYWTGALIITASVTFGYGH